VERVFEPFFQGGSSLNRPVEGLGLGLTIARNLARGMEGDLLVESVVGVGTTFLLKLQRR
jgi:signal transduction histidine kinase